MCHLRPSTFPCVIFGPPPSCASSSVLHLRVCHFRPSTFLCVIFGPPPSCVSSSALHPPVRHIRPPPSYVSSSALHLPVCHLRPSTFLCVIFGPPPSCASSSVYSTLPSVIFGPPPSCASSLVLRLPVRHLRSSTQAHLRIHSVDQGKNKTILCSGPGHLYNAASKVSVQQSTPSSQRAQKVKEEFGGKT